MVRSGHRMIDAGEIESLIRGGLAATWVRAVDTAGDGNHWEAVVVSPDFEGRTRVQQHQLVYRALGDHMRERIHALALRTYTPVQWERSGAIESARGELS